MAFLLTPVTCLSITALSSADLFEASGQESLEERALVWPLRLICHHSVHRVIISRQNRHPEPDWHLGIRNLQTVIAARCPAEMEGGTDDDDVWQRGAGQCDLDASTRPWLR